VLFCSQSGVSVDDLHVQLARSLNNCLAFADGHTMGDFGAVLAVVHQQQIELFHVVHTELQESVGQNVSVFSFCSEADLGHGAVALEASSDWVINTSWFSP